MLRCTSSMTLKCRLCFEGFLGTSWDDPYPPIGLAIALTQLITLIIRSSGIYRVTMVAMAVHILSHVLIAGSAGVLGIDAVDTADGIVALEIPCNSTSPSNFGEP